MRLGSGGTIYLGVDGSQPRIRLEGMQEAAVLHTFYRPMPAEYWDFWEYQALDSGAYSAWTKGETIDLNAYADFAQEAASWNRADWSFIAADLSVDQALETTLRNCETLRDQGLPAIPAFKQGHPWEYLDHLMENFDYIGLGSTDAGTSGQKTLRWLWDVFDRICDEKGRPKIGVHGYRLVSYANYFPFESVDSTTWAQNLIPHLRRSMPWVRTTEMMQHVLSYYARLPRRRTFDRKRNFERPIHTIEQMDIFLDKSDETFDKTSGFFHFTNNLDEDPAVESFMVVHPKGDKE